MRLRDRVTIRDGSGAVVAEQVRAAVQHQAAVLPAGSGVSIGEWVMIDRALAILPPGTPWGHGGDEHTLTVHDPTGDVTYKSDGPAIPRRARGRIHHLTVPLKRSVSS